MGTWGPKETVDKRRPKEVQTKLSLRHSLSQTEDERCEQGQVRWWLCIKERGQLSRKASCREVLILVLNTISKEH